VIKSRIESFAKYAGIATVGVEWSALVLYYLRMPGYFGGQYPISYFATLPQTHVIFATCYVLAAICCWIFTKHHLGKHFRVPTNVFGVSLGLFAAMALFPVDFDNSLIFTVHSMFAYGEAVAGSSAESSDHDGDYFKHSLDGCLYSLAAWEPLYLCV
jgi:hypothetical protein